MDEVKHCQDCTHFKQHYVKCGKQYMATYCGHCAHPRIKERKEDSPACERYRPQKTQTA